MQISPHFNLDELTRTSTALPNDPPVSSGANLVRLANVLLEPIRDLLAVPLIVHSGYRSLEVNRAVGGDPNSAHLEGRACDFHPSMGQDIKQAFDLIRLSAIPYDKLILEHHGHSWWIHVQIHRLGGQPRRRAYVAQIGPNGSSYREVTGA